ncbi:hypothetical protein [Virgibacillus sp. DJP39]|uniref:hypothetical protein n=1 Tax=Virgibacillus sp. DJP39 TaxID=3409790 RepID=UPI003BB6A5D9
MKKKLLFVIMFVLFSMYTIKPLGLVYAAPDPSEVEEIKQRSPLQIKGEVMKDTLLLDTSDERGYPSQIRVMALDVYKVIKKPDDLILEQDTLLNVTYSYVPSWVPMSGGAKMDIMAGDEIEIWLESIEGGWEPALGGDTVNHISYAEPRKEPIAEPFTHLLKRNIEENIELVILVGIMLFLLLVTMFFFLRKRVLRKTF